jgi:CRP-like cAMP-binding protein
MIKHALEKVMSEDMSEIWTILTGDEKRMITDNFTLHHFKKNQIIYAEREHPEYLWCLLKGKAKLCKDGVGGRQQILRLISPVQYFGYRAYFAQEDYVHTATAMEPSVIGAFPLEVVKKLIDSNRDVAWFFIHELSRNLGSADTRTVNLTQKHIRGRLAEALMVLIDHYGFEDDGMTLRIYMAREDLANLSNMTTSNAIRTLTAFVNEKLIIVDGRQIKITDKASLLKISKFG